MNPRTITHDEQVLDVLEYMSRRAPNRVAYLDERHPRWREAFVIDPNDPHCLHDGNTLWDMWLVAKEWLANNPEDTNE
jgi:hypothetical protein